MSESGRGADGWAGRWVGGASGEAGGKGQKGE